MLEGWKSDKVDREKTKKENEETKKTNSLSIYDVERNNDARSWAIENAKGRKYVQNRSRR